MKNALQLLVSSILVGSSLLVVAFWLHALSLSFGPDSDLEPWIAAGVILYGLMFVFVAAIPGLPGILWAKHIASGPASTWTRIAGLVWKVGAFVLLSALIVAVGALVAANHHA